jgi:hypothetical protein
MGVVPAAGLRRNHLHLGFDINGGSLADMAILGVQLVAADFAVQARKYPDNFHCT